MAGNVILISKIFDAITDVIKGRMVDKTYTKDVVLAGESAGGCLSLSFALHLRDAGKDMPKAVVALSPCTNMADKLPSRISNVETDYMVRNSLDGGNLEEALFGERKPLAEFLKNPYIYISILWRL